MPKKPVTPPPPTENEVELLVQEMVDSPHEERAAVAEAIRDSVMMPGGVNVAWDQLIRTRKPYGPNAGLQMLVGMLEAVKIDTSEGSSYDRSGVEPAVQLLAFFCNFKRYAQSVARLKKIMGALIRVLKDWENSHSARVGASWILRRCTE